MVLAGTPVKTGVGPGIMVLILTVLSPYGRMPILSLQLLATTGHAKLGPLRLLILPSLGSGEKALALLSVLYIPRVERGRNGVSRRPVLDMVRVVMRSMALR